MKPCARPACIQLQRAIAPNRWVASRSFSSGNHLRVAIWNEVDQTFLVLEGADATLWGYLTQRPGTDVQTLADKSGRSVEDVLSCVAPLMQTDLLSYADDPAPARVSTTDLLKPLTTSQAISGHESVASEFQQWALNEGYRWSATWSTPLRAGGSHPSLSQLKDWGVFSLRIEDRHLKMRPAFFATLLAARQLGFSITVATPGWPLNSVDLELIISAYPHLVEFGLLGGGCQEHDGITQHSGNAIDAQRASRYLATAGVRVGLKA